MKTSKISHTTAEVFLMCQIVREHLQLKAAEPLQSFLEAAQLLQLAPKILRREVFVKPQNNFSYTPPELVALHSIVKHYKCRTQEDEMFRAFLLSKLDRAVVNLNLTLIFRTDDRVLPSKINHIISC